MPFVAPGVGVNDSTDDLGCLDRKQLQVLKILKTLPLHLPTNGIQRPLGPGIDGVRVTWRKAIARGTEWIVAPEIEAPMKIPCQIRSKIDPMQHANTGRGVVEETIGIDVAVRVTADVIPELPLAASGFVGVAPSIEV